MAQENTHRKFRKVWTCCFRDMRANRQTDIQTRSSQYFAPYRRRSNDDDADDESDVPIAVSRGVAHYCDSWRIPVTRARTAAVAGA